MFDFVTIYEEVVSRAGGEQSTAEDVLKVERGLRIILQRWMNKRYPTWRVEHTTVAASGYSAAIPLSRGVDDVLGANVIDRRTGDTLTVMQRVSGSTYRQFANKHTHGMPAQFWVNRGEPPELMVFPIGTPGTVHVIELWYVATPPEWKRGSSGSEVVPSRWLEALLWAGAHDLASKRPPYDEALITRLKAEKDEAEAIALDADRDRARFRYRISG
jgi:hypothetical protein